MSLHKLLNVLYFGIYGYIFIKKLNTVFSDFSFAVRFDYLKYFLSIQSCKHSIYSWK